MNRDAVIFKYRGKERKRERDDDDDDHENCCLN